MDAEKKTWAEVQKAFANVGVKYQTLALEDATYNNIKWFVQNRHIKYIYIDSHGIYYFRTKAVWRTVVKLWDGPCVSMKKNDFLPGNEPTWCRTLPVGGRSANSFFSMRFDLTNALTYAHFDCCYTGPLKINANGQLVEGQPGQIGTFGGRHNDMSLALGMGDTSASRIYQGWYGEPYVEFWPGTEYQKFSQIEWETLGNGDDLSWALQEAIWQSSNPALDNYRLKGQGLFSDITLSRW
jgi:hypothetical protein